MGGDNIDSHKITGLCEDIPPADLVGEAGDYIRSPALRRIWPVRGMRYSWMRLAGLRVHLGADVDPILCMDEDVRVHVV